MDKVSIVIPVFNGADYLANAINSALKQTYENIEVIVVNDGSSDGGLTEAIALSFGENITYVSKSNGGVSTALNTGILTSTGDWIAWLSHDDVFLPDKIETQLDYINKSPSARVCYTDYYVIDAKGRTRGVLKMPSFPRETFLRHLFQCMFVCGSTTLVHRTCFDSIGLFDEKLRYAQDADMWLRIAREFEFIHIPQPLVAWRYHAAQGSKDEKPMLNDRREYLTRCLNRLSPEDFFPETKTVKNLEIARSKVTLYLARVMLRCHREPDIAIKLLIGSIRLWPSPTNPALYTLLFLVAGGWSYYKLGRKIAVAKRHYFPHNLDVPPVDFMRSSTVVEANINFHET